MLSTRAWGGKAPVESPELGRIAMNTPMKITTAAVPEANPIDASNDNVRGPGCCDG
jgi:hypothetical protein